MDDEHEDYQNYLKIFCVLIRLKDKLILEFLEKNLWQVPFDLQSIDIIKNSASVLGPRLLHIEFP